MYLSRMPINMSRRKSLSMVTSPYKMHAAIEAMFPNAESGSAQQEIHGRTLWRIDSQRGGGSCLYIASPAKPSLIGLDEQIGYPDLDPQYETCDYQPFLDSLTDGMQVAFRLTANPVRCVREDGPNGERKKMKANVTPWHQLRWLIGNQADSGEPDKDSRLGQAGLAACSDDGGTPKVMVTSERTLTVKKRGCADRPLVMVQFDGLATIIDVGLVRDALVCGIGKSKAFGCGMMTISPLA